MVLGEKVEASALEKCPSHIVSAPFEPAPQAARAARAFVASRVPPRCRALAELLVSELATNALRHAATPFRVGVIAGETVRLELWDDSTTPPRLMPATAGAESGRGLRILAALSSAWGVDLHSGGKVVWCELPASGSPFSCREEGSSTTPTASPAPLKAPG
jgi:hypothetical protein